MKPLHEIVKTMSNHDLATVLQEIARSGSDFTVTNWHDALVESAVRLHRMSPSRLDGTTPPSRDLPCELVNMIQTALNAAGHRHYSIELEPYRDETGSQVVAIRYTIQSPVSHDQEKSA